MLLNSQINLHCKMIFLILTITHEFIYILHTPIPIIEVMIINKVIWDCFDDANVTCISSLSVKTVTISYDIC